MSRGNQRGTIGIPRSVRRRCFRKGSGWRSSQLLSWFPSPQYRALEANTRFPWRTSEGVDGKVKLEAAELENYIQNLKIIYVEQYQWRNNKAGQNRINLGLVFIHCCTLFPVIVEYFIPWSGNGTFEPWRSGYLWHYGIMALQAVGPPYSRHSQATLLSGEWIAQMKSRKSHV